MNVLDESIEEETKKLLEDDIKNINFISYFCRSSKKTPIFLASINKKYTEIANLVKHECIKTTNPVISYLFNIDKLENFFYNKYQAKIDFFKDEIWRKKKRKTELIDITDNLEALAMEFQESEDYELKMLEVIAFARESIDELDQMEGDKEDFNNEIGELQEAMKQDPYYKFLLFIRNDKDIIFNKRTEDSQKIVHNKIRKYLVDCNVQVTEFKKEGFYKEFSPAKNYFITDLGYFIDQKLKEKSWCSDEDEFEKTAEEIAQVEEFNKIKELMGF